jgi:hypothetical protein
LAEDGRRPDADPQAEGSENAPVEPKPPRSGVDGWIRVFAKEWAERRPESQKLQDRSGASLLK